MRARHALAALLFSLPAAAAHADPCKAIPDKGPLPAELRPGTRIEGPVPYVGDGDSLCLALGPAPDRWVEIRLADFYAPELGEPGGPEARRALERLVRHRRLACRIEKRSYDRAVSRCTLDGVPLGDLLRKAQVPEGGRGR